MDKDVVHIHKGILFSYKKEQIWVSSSEMNEPRTQNEVSQKERNKHHILTHIYGI